MKTAKIVEAPNYEMSEDGTITNKLTKLPVTPNKGIVRLSVNGQRKSFKVDVLKETYFPATEEKKEQVKPKEEKKTAKEEKTSKKAKTDKKGKANKGKEDKTPKIKKVIKISRSEEIYIYHSKGFDQKKILEMHPDWSKGHVYNALKAAKEDHKRVERALERQKSLKANKASNED